MDGRARRVYEVTDSGQPALAGERAALAELASEILGHREESSPAISPHWRSDSAPAVQGYWPALWARSMAYWFTNVPAGGSPLSQVPSDSPGRLIHR